jgi:hypothetical protein
MTRAQAIYAGIIAVIIAAIAAAVIAVSWSSGEDGDNSTHGLSRDLTAAAGNATVTPTP